jgi:glycosyltransferase involved in cell wall biosynthesis
VSKTISIITPCFNEEENVRDCYEAVKALFADKLKGYAREHIFADNCSTDRTSEILRQIAATDRSAKVIINSRNFGPMRSTYNAVLSASGDAVLLFLPADMQDPPSLLPEFVKLWEQGYEIVYGIRSTRTEGGFMRVVRRTYYRLISELSFIDVPVDVGDFQLVDQKVVRAMRQIEDAYPFMRLMTFECGFRSVGVPYHWQARKKGVSKNRIFSLIDQGLNGIITFTSVPLRLALYVGFVLATLSLIYAFGTLVGNLIVHGSVTQPGIATLIVALFFFAGVQLFFMGIIGEYILAIYGQVRKKPLVIERERINFNEASPRHANSAEEVPTREQPVE